MPFKAITTVIISAHHFLPEHSGMCRNSHGHNWKITVTCGCEYKDLKDGMVVDFGWVKRIIRELDHTSLNNFIENPTAELIAHYLFSKIPKCEKIEVEETPGNVVVYEDRDGRGV